MNMKETNTEKIILGKEKLKAALLEANRKEIEAFGMSDDDNEEIELNPKYKKGINRIFREVIGTNKIPHPEVDTLFERIHSSIVRKFKRTWF